MTIPILGQPTPPDGFRPGAGWKTTVSLDRITWGHLRRLVEIAAYMDDDDAVEFEWEETYDIPYQTGIVLRGEG